MRIHHVMPAFGRIPEDPIGGPRSGIVHSALSFARASASRGHEVRLVGWAEGKPRFHVSPEGLEIGTHPGWGLGRVGRWDVRWLAPMATRALSSPKPDVLHVHFDPNLLRLRATARILHLHSLMEPVVTGSYIRLLNLADAVVCCSAAVRESFLTATSWHPDRTFALPNGTDPVCFRPPNSTERAAARAHFGLSDESCVVLFVGALVWEKGVLHLARAFRMVESRVPQAVLLMAGDGRLWGGLGSDRSNCDEYERLVKSNVPSTVRMLGKLPHDAMPKLFHAADVMVVPSVREAFGMVALDASATGIPVIASKVGGLPEIIGDGCTGILVPPGDEEELAQAIIRLVQDEELRLRLGTAGRQRSLRFAWNRISAEMERVYNQVRWTQPVAGWFEHEIYR